MFQTKTQKENGNNNNGNGINLGGNAYAKGQISPMSPVLTKTPLPVIGGKLKFIIKHWPTSMQYFSVIAWRCYQILTYVVCNDCIINVISNGNDI